MVYLELSLTAAPSAAQHLDDGQPRDPRVWVEAEDPPNRLLLETKVAKADTFQKQQGKLRCPIHTRPFESNGTFDRNIDSMD